MSQDSTPPVTAELVQRRPLPPPPPRRSLLGRLGLVLLLLIFCGSVVLNVLLLGYVGLTGVDGDSRVQEKHYSGQRMATAKVAILVVDGLISNPDGFIKQQIDRVERDKNVQALVLRIDSPGGTVNASDYFYHRLQQLGEKRPEMPIVVSMGGIAASGGYYMAMAVGNRKDTIFAEPTTWTGSIGVVIPHYNISGLMKNWDIQDDSIASHRLKTAGSFTKPMTDEERAILQGLVDESFNRFKEVVRAGRPKFRESPTELDKLATGQVYTADQAKRAGLVDRIGFLDDAVARALELADLDAENAHVIKYQKETSFASLFLESCAPLKPGWSTAVAELTAVLDAATPRAYYLCTWLPGIVGKEPE